MKYLFITIAILFTFQSYGQFKIQTATDKMTGEKAVYMVSEITKPDEPLGSPYQNTAAALAVYSKHKIALAIPNKNLSGGEYIDGNKSYYFRIRMNGETNVYIFYEQDAGSDLLIASRPKGLREQLQTADRMLIEVNWYREGDVYFDINTDNYAELMPKILNQ